HHGGEIRQSQRMMGVRQLIENSKRRLQRLQAIALALPGSSCRLRCSGARRVAFHGRGVSHVRRSGSIMEETVFLQAKHFCLSANGRVIMFLKNCWYVAALDHELIDGKLLARTLLGENVLLYRGESGRVVAMNDRCPHRGALLSHGRLEGDGVRCMYHGIKYDGSGKCVQIP